MGFWTNVFMRGNKPASKRKPFLDSHLARAAFNGAWEEAKPLIAQGAVSGGVDGLEAGHSALFWAALAGNLEFVRKMNPGADMEQEMLGQTALMAACSRGRLEIAKLLMSSKARQARDHLGLSALCFAASSGQAELVAALLDPAEDGWSPGKNERWLAACIAAAMSDAETLSVFEQRGWDRKIDREEEWSEEDEWSVESATCAAISGELVFHGFLTREDEDFFSYTEGVSRESWHMQATLAICQKKQMPDASKNLVIKKAIELDFSEGAPPAPSDWGVQAFAASAKHAFSGYEAIMERCPDLATTKSANDGITPLMLAAHYAREFIPLDLLERSCASATDNRGWSAMRHFLAKRVDVFSDGGSKRGSTRPIFCELGSRMSNDAWAADESQIWRRLIEIGASFWSEPLVESMKFAISRSSQKSLSRALAIAIAEEARPAMEMLFPLTSTAENSEAIIQEFILRNVKSPEISALVAERSAILREAEELANVTAMKEEGPRLPAKRL